MASKMMVAALAALVVAPACDTAGDEEETLRLRVNVKDLSPEERGDLVDAILLMRDTPSPLNAEMSYYDQFVSWHWSLYQCDPDDPDMVNPMFMGHGGPAFLPWHRAFLLEFEDALRTVSGKPITLPYWDWTDPESTEAVFTDDFMGGSGDPSQGFSLTSGPFNKDAWPVNIEMSGAPILDVSNSSHLVRKIGCAQGAIGEVDCMEGTPTLPTADEVTAALAVPNYDVAPFNTWSDPEQSFRNRLEGFVAGPSMTCAPSGVMLPGSDGMAPLAMHNMVHGWVGGITGVEMVDGEPVPILGTMSGPISPADPVFFLNHSNVDRIWAQWQELHGIDTYAPSTELPLNNIDDRMFPFGGATPRTVADIRALSYEYQ